MNDDRSEELRAARSLFPLMAGTDVFEIWLTPIIKKFGWPFRSLSDSITGSGWEKVFTWQPLEKIAQLRWHLHELPFDEDLFTPQAKSTISAMFETHVCNLNNPGLLEIENTRERFASCYEFTRRTGRAPVPCVMLDDIGGYSILDGNHRIGAIFSVYMETDIPCVLDSWVGSLSNGTVV